MDDHFQTAKPEKNMPVVLALLGIWYNNFLGAQSAAIIPYCQRLAQLPAYLQQLDMESNGKSASIHGLKAEHSTGPIIWGQTGTNGQHAFFQLLHQGSKLVPVDFIAGVKERMGDQFQHKVLLTNMIAQSCSLMSGEPNDDIHKRYPGNKPSNTLLLDDLSPHSLGMLIALYEHKVFVQGVIWEINSFDQWGVELGKRLTHSLLENDSIENLDPSTRELLRRIQKDDST
jgi:glucose-6-phosphate isomerase